jgi:hypothetical protein
MSNWAIKKVPGNTWLSSESNSPTTNIHSKLSVKQTIIYICISSKENSGNSQVVLLVKLKTNFEFTA